MLYFEAAPGISARRLLHRFDAALYRFCSSAFRPASFARKGFRFTLAKRRTIGGGRRVTEQEEAGKEEEKMVRVDERRIL